MRKCLHRTPRAPCRSHASTCLSRPVTWSKRHSCTMLRSGYIESDITAGNITVIRCVVRAEVGDISRLFRDQFTYVRLLLSIAKSARSTVGAAPSRMVCAIIYPSKLVKFRRALEFLGGTREQAQSLRASPSRDDRIARRTTVIKKKRKRSRVSTIFKFKFKL